MVMMTNNDKSDNDDNDDIDYNEYYSQNFKKYFTRKEKTVCQWGNVTIKKKK